MVLHKFCIIIIIIVIICTEAEESSVAEPPQVIVFATFQGVPRSPPRITQLEELVGRIFATYMYITKFVVLVPCLQINTVTMLVGLKRDKAINNHIFIVWINVKS